MSTAVADRDAIVAKAIEIGSAEERDAFLAHACGGDPALRRQVEELIAAHPRQESREKSSGPAVSLRRLPQHVDANHVEARVHSSSASHHPEKEMRKLSRGVVMTGMLLLLSVAVASIGFAVWAWRAEEHARASQTQAIEESKRAKKAQEEAEHQRDEALATRKGVAAERDKALGDLQAALSSDQDAKAVLGFFQNKVLSAGRPTGWAEGQGKDVTLRKAVDAAEGKVAEAFADRPLAEAAIREMLGSTYLDLGEALLAVRQQERALALREALLGADHPDTNDSRNKLAVAYRFADRHDDAGHLFDPTLPSASHAAALAIRGTMLLSQKKPAEAEKKLRECLSIYRQIQPKSWTTFDAQVRLGEALQEQKKYAEAEPLLLSGYKGLKQHEAEVPSWDKPRLNGTVLHLVQLYEAWGKKAEADKWQKELAAAQASKKT